MHLEAKMDTLDNRIYQAPRNVDAETAEFLSGLTELSAKYGIAITGLPVLFVMEREDFLYSYRTDGDSNLHLG